MKDGSLNGKTPSSNIQIPNKSRTSKSETVLEASSVFLIETRNFFGPWILGFGISDRLFLQSVDSFSQIKVKLRQPAFAVR
jgi:hypothetical protein